MAAAKGRRSNSVRWRRRSGACRHRRMATGRGISFQHRQNTTASRLLVAALVAAPACGGPLGPIAGGRVAGNFNREAVSDWSFAAQHRHAALEVRPGAPYSVTVNFYLAGSHLYLDIGKHAGFHRWRRYIRADDRVRIRFGTEIYEAVATPVTDTAEIAALLPAYFAKDSSEPAPGCAPPFPVECFPDTVFVRLDAQSTRIRSATDHQQPGDIHE